MHRFLQKVESKAMPPQTGLYPSVLFHFTDRDGLWGILKENFRVSFCRERIIGPDGEKRFGVPVVSFSDLRLSEVANHMGRYKGYGIGLSKDWARNSGLNPVFYMSSKCPSTSLFLQSIDRLYDQVWSQQSVGDFGALLEPYMGILNMLRYIKNYDGDLERSGMPVEHDYCFANEREWRYVPPVSTGVRPFVSASKIDTKEMKRGLNEGIAHVKLEFDPDDIQYLIVKEESERVELMRYLQTAKKRYNDEEKLRLSSKILTGDQVRNDF